jgi:hypothetical protein
MSDPNRPDDVTQYAPKWLREGNTRAADFKLREFRPRDAGKGGTIEFRTTTSVDFRARAATLPPAPQLHVQAQEPAWQPPFDGDIRAWRAVDPPIAADLPITDDVLIAEDHSIIAHTPSPRSSGNLLAKAAVASIAVSAIGALGLVLFPNAPSSDLPSDNEPMAATTILAKRETNSGIKSVARLASPDARTAEAAPKASDSVKIANNPLVAATATATPQVTRSVYVVAGADSASTSQAWRAQPQSDPPQIQQSQTQPKVQTVVQSGQALAPQRGRAAQGLTRDEIERLVTRGEAFLASGDVTAARLLLERAAEARDPRAALALGSTYDPNILKNIGVVGIRPDPERAHLWYERAAEFGSGEATERLTALAQLGH